MSPDGQGAWVAAGWAAGDSALDHAVSNGAPALSNDESTLYVTIHTGSSGRGRLVALDSTTLKPLARAALKDARKRKTASALEMTRASSG